MRIGVPKETSAGERRVALVPESAKKLIQAGYSITVEAGAGDPAGFPDAAYRESGVAIETDSAIGPRRRHCSQGKSPGETGQRAG